MTTIALAIDGRMVTGETLRAAGATSVNSLTWQALVNGVWTNVASGTASYVIPANATGLAYRLTGSAVDDGSTIYSPATGSVTVDTKKASAPVLSGPDLAVIGSEGPDPHPIFGSFTFSDADKGNYGGGSLLLQDSTETKFGGDGKDVLGIQFLGTNAGQFSYNAATRELKYAFTAGVATTIGTIDATLNGNGTDLKVVFNTNATNAAVAALVHNLQFTNNDDSPTPDRLITLRITDPTGGSVQRVTGTHIDNTPDAPVFTSAASFAANENQLSAGTVAAIDPDRESNQPQGITYSLASGNGSQDNGAFTIDSATGALKFNAAPDYEDPFHSPAYSVRVRATDSDGSTTDQVVTVNLRNVNEAPFGPGNLAQAKEDGGPVSFVATFVDPDANDTDTITVDTSGLHGTLTLAGKTFTYDPHGQFESLAGWMMAADSFNYTVTDAGGLSTTFKATVMVQGENDPATITGTFNTTLQEDSGSGPFFFVSAPITVNDVDAGENMILGITPGNGNFGLFTVAGGKWTYEANNADLQSLGAGETRVETATITSADGTASQQLSVTLVGVNDAPVITVVGSAQGDVTEDGANGSGTAVASGRFLASDADAHDKPVWTGSAQGTYGNFAIDAATGQWTYTLANSADATQALAGGQTVFETFTATSSDGHGGSAQQQVRIAVHGANDAPVIDSSSELQGVVQDPAATGTMTLDTGAPVYEERATIVDAGGQLTLLARVHGDAGIDEPALVRYSTSGELDTAFGAGGHVIVGNSITPRDVVQDSSGDYIVTGYSAENYQAYFTDWSVQRFLPDGSVDTSFGQDGRAVIDFGGYDMAAHATVDPSCRIVVSGTAYDAVDGGTAFTVARLDASGRLDTSFGDAGHLSFDSDSVMPGAAGATVDSAGRVLVWGEQGVARFLSDGHLDTSFGDNGVVSAPAGVQQVALDSAGHLLVAWHEDGGTWQPPTLAVEMLDDNGHAVDSFGQGGTVHTGLDAWQFSLAFDAADKPLLGFVGYINIGFELARFNSDGTFDATFHGGTVATADLAGDEEFSGIGFLPGGGVVVSGTTWQWGVGQFAYAAFTPDGSPDAQFGPPPQPPTASGQLVVATKGADAGDAYHWNGNAMGTYGEFQVTDAGAWTYSLDLNLPATQALQPGTTATDHFTATVTDSFGVATNCEVVVTVLGQPGP